jgi:hypothetical protein
MTGTTFRVGLIQTRASRSPAANLDAVAKLIREAKTAGAEYVQTPEMTNIMEVSRDKLFATIVPEENDTSLATFRELARNLSMHLHIGSLAVKATVDKAANRAFLIDPRGEIVARYDKIHMFDVDLANGESYRESRSYRPGELAVLHDLPWGRLGLTVCYDLRFPALYRALAEAGASSLKFKLINRNINHPFTPLGVFVIDQWRRIGVTAEHQQLDVSQQSVVDAVAQPGHGPLVVLAGPGTGKTTTLVEAVLARVESGTAPERVLTLTFSRRAAHELRDRIAARLDRSVSAQSAWTFHGFAYALCCDLRIPEDLGRPLRVLSGPEQDVVVRDLLAGDLAEGTVDWPADLHPALGTGHTKVAGHDQEIGARTRAGPPDRSPRNAIRPASARAGRPGSHDVRDLLRRAAERLGSAR